MVSAAKLRRAQQRVVNLRPYSRKLLEVIADISMTRRVTHPLLSSVSNPWPTIICIGKTWTIIAPFALNLRASARLPKCT